MDSNSQAGFSKTNFPSVVLMNIFGVWKFSLKASNMKVKEQKNFMTLGFLFGIYDNMSLVYLNKPKERLAI